MSNGANAQMDPAREFISALFFDELSELARGNYYAGRNRQIETWFSHKANLVELVEDGLGIGRDTQLTIMRRIARGLAEDKVLATLYARSVSTQIDTQEAKSMVKAYRKRHSAKKGLEVSR